MQKQVKQDQFDQLNILSKQIAKLNEAKENSAEDHRKEEEDLRKQKYANYEQIEYLNKNMQYVEEMTDQTKE